jgi:hypothetical protein
MSSQQPVLVKGAVAVVVLPSGTVGMHVLDLVRRWYAAGLLRPGIWVLPEDVVVADGEAPKVEAHHLTATTSSTGDLFEMVARHRWQWVRLVLSQVLYRSDTVDDGQLAAGEAVRAWLRESLPQALAGHVNATGTELRSVNLITGVTGLSEMKAELRPMHWDVHVVTSPEDRPNPERANLFVRSGNNLVPLSLLSTAVVAGLMPGQVTGPFDQVEGDQSAVFGKAMVVRPTVRGLLATGIVDPVAREAASKALQSGSTAVAEPARFILGDREQIGEDLLAWLDQVDHRVLDLRPYDVVPDVGTETITIAKGAREAAGFVWRALITLLWSAIHWLRRHVEDVATRAIVGENSGVRLTLHADVANDLAEQVVALEAKEVERREREIVEITRRPPRTPVAAVWRDLSQAAHAVLDGGPLPQGAPEHREGSRRALLGSPHDVVVDPRDTFTLSAEEVEGLAPRVLAAWSPLESQQLAAELEGASMRLQSVLASARAEVESLRASPPEDPERRAAYEEAMRAARSRVAASEAALQRCLALQRRFEAWLRRRVDGLLWRLGERVIERRRRAAAAEQRAGEQGVATMGLDEGAPGRLRKRFLQLGWLVIGATAAYLIFFHWSLLEEETQVERWTWAGVVLLIALGLVVAAALWWFRGVLRILHRYRQGALARAQGVALFELAHGDRRRLDDIQRQLGQWVGMLGWSLHTPWASLDEPEADAGAEGNVDGDLGTDAAIAHSAEDSEKPEEAEALAQLPLPACFRLGLPVIDEVDRVAIARKSASWLTAQGWRTRAWRRLVGHHLSARNVGDEEEIDLALERLERDDGRGPAERERLLEDLGRGRPQRAALETVLATTRAYLRETRMCGHDLSVEHLGDAVDRVVTTDQQFLEEALVPASALAKETWSARAQVRGSHEQLRTQCWASVDPSTTHALGFDLSSLDRAALGQSGLLDLIVRVDVSHWRDAADLRLFGSPPEDDNTYVFEGADKDFV